MARQAVPEPQQYQSIAVANNTVVPEPLNHHDVKYHGKCPAPEEVVHSGIKDGTTVEKTSVVLESAYVFISITPFWLDDRTSVFNLPAKM